MVYVAAFLLLNNSKVWQFELTCAERIQHWLPYELTLSIRQAFRYSGGMLSHQFYTEPPRDRVLTQLVTTPNRNYTMQQSPIMVLGSVFDPVGQITQYLWKDGLEIFVANTHQLCLMQALDPGPLHIGPYKWTIEFTWFPQQSSL